MLNTQRLHIINSIRASREDPSSNDAMPGIILMGTFAGAVDWLIVDKIRKPLGFPNGPNTNFRAHNQTQQQCEPELFIEGFGYTTSDPRWVDASSAVVNAKSGMSREARGVYHTAFSTKQGPMIEIGSSGYHNGAILDLHGRTIASFDGFGYRTYAVRDIMHKNGMQGARGTYFVRMNIAGQTYNEHVFIAH
jgi:hypothetical protein